MIQELLTTREIARRLQLSATTIRVWAREGRIPAVRVSTNRLRFEWEAVLRALQEGQVSEQASHGE